MPRSRDNNGPDLKHSTALGIGGWVAFGKALLHGCCQPRRLDYSFLRSSLKLCSLRRSTSNRPDLGNRLRQAATRIFGGKVLPVAYGKKLHAVHVPVARLVV